MTRAPALHAVPKQPQEPPITDMQSRMREEIAARRWDETHIAADKRRPIPWFDRVRRTWVK